MNWFIDKCLTLLLWVLTPFALVALMGCLIYDKHAEWKLGRAKPNLKD